MKLILRADVENLGSLGDVVEVKPGYGRNFLLPQGLAMVASQANLKVFEQERNKLQARMDSLRGEAQEMQARLEALEVVITMHVGDNDKLYGSVTTTIIGDALNHPEQAAPIRCAHFSFAAMPHMACFPFWPQRGETFQSKTIQGLHQHAANAQARYLQPGAALSARPAAPGLLGTLALAAAARRDPGSR